MAKKKIAKKKATKKKASKKKASKKKAHTRAVGKSTGKRSTYSWNIRRVPHRLKVSGKSIPHPGRSCAVFVVHGIGEQAWTETAANLRSGFEDALEAIQTWQQAQPKDQVALWCKDTIPPPFVFGGFWANYTDLKATFRDDWDHFNDRERLFFGYLWKLRTFSVIKTYRWFIKQQIRLLGPTVLREVGVWAWLLYLPLQVVSLAALTFALIRHPKLITGFLTDVRLYLEPKGLVEKAIVERIDERVGQVFCRMIGLDLNFRRLPRDQLIEASGERITFERVVWVAHSLGTVISYNVLSDLFHRADDRQARGDAEQKAGVRRFRKGLRRFVTMGSPLDKVALLFGKRSLRPWPRSARTALLEGGETITKQQPGGSREWWINFYHVLDPVSGPLSNKLICRDHPPANLHARSGILPGWAHVVYWRDLRTLRFILGRTYGKAYLHDREFIPWPASFLTALGSLAYLVWAVLLIVGVYVLIKWGPIVADALIMDLMASLGLD